MRRYAGKVQAVVLDWAGTTIDHGCFAPTMVFVEGFEAKGVAVTIQEARRPMGMYKRDHIAAVIAMPAVQARWVAAHGSPSTDEDVEAMFQAFIPRQLEVIANYTELISGVAETIEALRKRGTKVGSSTGYTAEMMALVTPAAAEQGYAPDCLVTSDRVSVGRPAPWLIYHNMEQMGVYPVQSVVKIGDTVADIQAGLNAGAWTIGITATGNEMGMTAAEVQALSPEERQHRLTTITEKFYQAGAHYVVDSLADVPPLIDEIEHRLA